MVEDVPQIDNGDVHVWLVRTTSLVPRTMRLLARVMSGDERSRMARFAADLHRRQYAIGRGLLRVLIGAYLKCAPARVSFAYGPQGKPEIANADADPLRFNVAHSGEVVALAFANHVDVGIDVERIVATHDWLDVARHTCTARELDDVVQLTPSARAERFFSIWTRREAFVKATGQGVAAMTSDLEIPSTSDGWMVVPVDAGPGYAGALAVQHTGATVSHFTWMDETHDAGFCEYAASDSADCR